MTTFSAQTSEEVVEIIRWAVSASEPLEVLGGGTKRDVANPYQTAHALDVSGLSGIVDYEPEELVLTVRPGTGMAALHAALGEANQIFAFEPPDLAPLLGSAGEATFGGTYASNFAGPRRIAAGAVRDHMLGVAAVSGRGEPLKAGGRVVKNVTGYDIARALAGSWGTLAVATELTVKVLPRPETETTLIVLGETPDVAMATMAKAMGSSADVSGAAHCPADVAAVCLPNANASITALRLEGFGPSVAARRDALSSQLSASYSLDADVSRAFWRAVRDVAPFVGTNGAVWRCSVVPSAGASVAAAAPAGTRAIYDWAGGLVWLETPAVGDGGGAAIRLAIAAAGGGHATLLRAPMDMRLNIPTFHPEEAGLAALAERLRRAFDPEQILAPGRLVAR